MQITSENVVKCGRVRGIESVLNSKVNDYYTTDDRHVA